jgi:hypothetical protein
MISTKKVINNLLRERGNFYSSREYLLIALGILSYNIRPLLLPYNSEENYLLL